MIHRRVLEFKMIAQVTRYLGDQIQRLAPNLTMLDTEVLGGLVPPSVFKIAGPSVKPAAGGFDSHALPPFYLPRFPASRRIPHK